MLKVNILEPEAYLGAYRICIVGLFRVNSKRIKRVNYFRKYAPLQVFDWVLNTDLLGQDLLDLSFSRLTLYSAHH